MIVNDWHEKYGKCGTTLFNMYGTTETAIQAIIQRLDNTENIHAIGRTLDDLRVYLLDSFGEPVLMGAEGEIYIGGAGVARGYLNHPELTIERFLPDPFSESPRAQMYRTGDLARYFPDGNLMFLGRADQQVKIRGFRIELGEIEARLAEHPLVFEGAVQTYGSGSDVRLVAYVVSDENTDGFVQSLHTHLSNLLPDYMVPAAYVRLSSLPLTSNCKLDRSALPAPDDNAYARQQYEAPQDELEVKLAQIWCELLNIQRISRHDNFFALGGNSLLIVRLLAQLRQIGLDTTVREVFDVPTLAALARTLTHYKTSNIPPNMIVKDSIKITPEMLPLINLSQADIDSIVAQVSGGVANIQDIYGLTPLQSGMLYHHLLAKDSDPYTLQCRLSFIDRESLERYANAMQQIIDRHDVLRTVIFWDGLNEPAQVVLRQVPSLFTEITSDESDKVILDRLSEEFNPRQYKLDLTKAPLVRLLAAPSFERNWTGIQLMHHMFVDHSTQETLYTEMHAIMNGNIGMLPKPKTFRHFVAQTRLAANPDEHTRFFTEMLGDIGEPTLPFGLSDVDQNGTECDELYLELPAMLNKRLREQAQNLQVSLASVCHLAWAQVLAKASGRESIVFGTVLLGRLQAGEGNTSVTGPMINTLPIRINIDKRSVEIAVRDTHTQLSALLAHEHATLALAQQCSSIPARLPLFSALLNYRHNQMTENVIEPLPGVSIIDGDERTNYPLTLSVEDNGTSLGVTVQVISPISAARICAYMQQALKSLADALAHSPQQPIGKLEVMPPEERSLLLHKWNQTTITHSPACCLHQLIEAQVERDGEAFAVECEGKTLSYSELNAQANELAHYLITKGVKPDDRIALCVERSTTAIVAMLGILKSGCAYVPLDPVYASQRLSTILQDAHPVFVLTDETGRKALGDHEVPVIALDQPLPDANSQIGNLDATKLALTPAHLAYVMYTSGSTGTPKGVMVEHQQVVRLFGATYDKFDLNIHDKWCLFHSISFDISVWEIWGALRYGSQLSIASDSTIRSVDEFYDWICTKCISMLCQTPSVFKMLMRAKNTSLRLDQLWYVIFVGEELNPMIAKEWFKKFNENDTILCNMYGPTEATVYAAFQRIEVLEDAYSIGRPLADLRVYLLDVCGEPVILGAEGEMYVSGLGITRGYLNRSELTAERFLLDPFTNDLDTRMYRTGDLGRYLPDGNLVFLGRTDQQVKLRGFRIELGEIEAHLVEHPQVHEAVVQLYGHGSDARLVAYVVADEDTFSAKHLRSHLMGLLPDYMVPAAYVHLKSLPLSPNGKLDRRSLPAPSSEAFTRQEYEDPQGDIEKKLARIWTQLLNIDRVSRHDNFFALGGHSLSVVRLLAQLRQIGLDTTIREVFNAHTLATLASTLAHYKAVTIPSNLIRTDSTQITPEMLPLITFSQADIDAIIGQVPAGVANIQDIYGLTPFQSGMLYHHLKAKDGDPYLLVHRLSFHNRKLLEHYTNAMQKVIERHDILRTAIFWDGLSEPAQVVLRQVPSILTETALHESNEQDLHRISREYRPNQYRLNLSQAPLVRLLSSPASDGSWVALQLMHHTIIDHSHRDNQKKSSKRSYKVIPNFPR